jgi:hypothetical protein
MNCAICLEDDILEKDIHYMECLHHVCFNCFKQFLNNKCPFCRELIHLSKKSYQTEDLNDDTNDDTIYDTIYENILPIIRINRNEIKRKKYNKRRKELIKFEKEQSNINILPNIKHRYNRKIDNILI